MDLYDNMSAYKVESVTTTTNKESMLDGKNLLFMTGFSMGMLFFYLVGESFWKSAGNMILETLRQVQRMEPVTQGLFTYILDCRARQALLLTMTAVGYLEKLMFYLVIGLAGFVTGLMLLLFAYQFGVMGILIAIGMIFPQVICYFKFFRLLYEHQYDKGAGDTSYYHNHHLITNGRYHKVKRILWKIVRCFFWILLGVFMETYINTWIVQKILFFL